MRVHAPTDSYSVAFTSCASSHEREYMPQPTAHSVASTSYARSHEREYMPQAAATA